MVTIATFDHVATSIASTNKMKITSSSNNTTSFAQTLQGSTNKLSEEKMASSSTEDVENAVPLAPVEESLAEEGNRFSLSLDSLLPTSKVNNSEKSIDELDLSALLQTTTVKDLIELIGGENLPTGENLTIENVASALNMTSADLQSLLMKLTQSTENVESLWDGLKNIDENVFSILQQISASVNGSTTTLNKKEAEQAISLLKLIDLAAPKTDLLLKQELQVAQVKDWLSTLTSQIKEKTVEKSVELPFTKTIVRVQTAVTETANITQTMTTANKMPTVTIQLPTNGTPQTQATKFVEEFQTVMNRAQFSSNAASTRMLIKLYPENLGTIRIELIQKDGLFTAKLLASNPLGKQLLEGSLNQLKQGFVNQNLQVDRIDITQALSEPNKGERQFNQQQQHPFNRQNPDEETEGNKDDKLPSFEAFLAEMEE